MMFLRSMSKENKVILGILFSLLLVFGVLVYNSESKKVEVNNFEDCVNAGYAVAEGYPQKCYTLDGKVFVQETNEEVNEYFAQEIWKRAVDKQGGAIPIEGFTPEMYLGLYSGLIKEDFDGVSAINGHYEIVDENLEFVMDSGELITSADGTVNEEGLTELLGKLSERLGIEISSNSDVDLIFEKIED